jgi:hypothetical protein
MQWGWGNLGIFITCIKSIHLQNVLYLILGFTFGIWDLYFDFHKVILYNIIIILN